MLVNIDPVELRQKLEQAIAEVIGELEGGGLGEDEPVQSKPPSLASQFPVDPANSIDGFDYKWPANAGEEHFEGGRAYRLDFPSGPATAVLAWTHRWAWGKERGRAVVFEHKGEDPKKWYPWTEFTETDDERYAAPIPDPARPRAILSDGMPLPPPYDSLPVARSDALFASIRRGPSLRLVLDKDRDLEMVRHGHRVAVLRRRVS